MARHKCAGAMVSDPDGLTPARRGPMNLSTMLRGCTAAIAHGKHIVMGNVEGDALAGPLLGRRAKEAGVVYSLARAPQPALICEHVDCAPACGFKVVAAGKGTRYHPSYHQSTPDKV